MGIQGSSALIRGHVFDDARVALVKVSGCAKEHEGARAAYTRPTHTELIPQVQELRLLSFNPGQDLDWHATMRADGTAAR